MSSNESDTQRPFICPCGKSYRSYPALFTHVKQKHNGIPPGQVIRPKSVNKRGRPRKYPQPQQQNQPLSSLQDFRAYAQNHFNNQDEQIKCKSLLQQIIMAKNRYKDSLSKEISQKQLLIQNNIKIEPKAQKQQNLILIKQIKSFFNPMLERDTRQTKQIQQLINLNKYYTQCSKHTIEFPKIDYRTQTYQIKLNNALIKFLSWIEDTCSKRQYKNYELLISLLIYFYEVQITPIYCQATTLNYTSYINAFYQAFLQKISRQKCYANIFILQKNNPRQALLFLHQWLLINKMTNIKIQINSHYQDKDLIISKTGSSQV